jgi:hypothetical protein
MQHDVQREPPVSAQAIADRPSLTGARVFTAAIFALLGAAFLASTYLLTKEFADYDWPSLILAHSHLFLFFPTFGILALFAFHLPASVFVHLYWYNIPSPEKRIWGRLRFVHGFAWALAISFFVSTYVLGEWAQPRHLWEVSPQAHDRDRGAIVPDCRDASGAPCRRLPTLQALSDLRDKSVMSIPYSRFARPCLPPEESRLMEALPDSDKARWCFPAGQMMTADSCCKVQRAFRMHVSATHATPAGRSDLARAEARLQFVKVFFVVVTLVIAMLLLFWRDQVQHHYPDLTTRIDWHVMIGGFAMLLWPIMDYAYQDIENVLMGRLTVSMQLRLSLVIGPWLAILFFYFLKQWGGRTETIGQIAGVATALLAFLARDELRDFATKQTGIGMPFWMFPAMAAALLVGAVALLVSRRWVPKTWQR